MERETDHVLPFLDVLINNTRLTPKCDHRSPEKNFHNFVHQLPEFHPLYLKIGVNQNLDLEPLR